MSRDEQDGVLDADGVRRRLAQIQDALLGLPPGPSTERHTLLTEQDRLRAEARRVSTDWDRGRSREDLRAELEAINDHRSHLLRDRSGFATSKGGSNHGATAGAWVKLQRQAKAGGDISRLTARIAELESLLDEAD